MVFQVVRGEFTLKLTFKDSVDTAFTSNGPNSVGQFTNGTLENLHIASRQPGNSLFFRGCIDEIGLWLRAISGSEASDLFNSGAGFNPYAVVPVTNKAILYAQDM